MLFKAGGFDDCLPFVHLAFLNAEKIRILFV